MSTNPTRFITSNKFLQNYKNNGTENPKEIQYFNTISTKKLKADDQQDWTDRLVMIMMMIK